MCYLIMSTSLRVGIKVGEGIEVLKSSRLVSLELRCATSGHLLLTSHRAHEGPPLHHLPTRSHDRVLDVLAPKRLPKPSHSLHLHPHCLPQSRGGFMDFILF